MLFVSGSVLEQVVQYWTEQAARVEGLNGEIPPGKDADRHVNETTTLIGLRLNCR